MRPEVKSAKLLRFFYEKLFVFQSETGTGGSAHNSVCLLVPNSVSSLN